MKTDVGALVLLDVYGYFRTRLQPFAGRQLIVFHVRPNNIVGLASRHALGKLTGVIGINLPSNFFLIRPSDLHLHSVKWAPFGSPPRPEDKCIGLLFLLLL